MQKSNACQLVGLVGFLRLSMLGYDQTFASKPKFHITYSIRPASSVHIKTVVTCLTFIPDLFDPAHLSRFQPDLDAVRVLRRFRQNIPNNTPGSLARALVFFQNYLYLQPRSESIPVLPVHN